MVRAHARSWRATYAGLLPDAAIADVVKSRPARIVRWQARLAEPKYRRGSFVGELDGRVVGFVFWGPTEGPDATPETAEVYAIYLDPDAIGRGIGRALLDAAVGDMVADGFAAAILWVLDTNDRARRFYEAGGWSPRWGDEDRGPPRRHAPRGPVRAVAPTGRSPELPPVRAARMTSLPWRPFRWVPRS